MNFVSRRGFAEARYGIGQCTWTKGGEGMGRKIFHKGWKHMEPRKPHTLQERWHRAAVERLFHPSIIERIGIKTVGDLHSLEWRMSFESLAFDASPRSDDPSLQEFKKLSPWHDIPLGFEDTEQQTVLFNYVNEIPKGTRAKMECATEEEWNPIKQDTKKGELRFFKYGDLPFNYGFVPQTWEDPGESSQYCDVAGLTGDGDPVDVVEVSQEPMPMGAVVPIKVLALLGLIDEGETDWKVIGLRANHPKAQNIHTIRDAESLLGVDFGALVLDWFRNYKVPDGKPVNAFTHNEEYQSPEMAVQVLEECHRHWNNLILGAVQSKFSLLSVTHKHLVAQGVTSGFSMPECPKIEYPRYEKWRARTHDTFDHVDNAYEEYELDEEAPDQRKI